MVFEQEKEAFFAKLPLNSGIELENRIVHVSPDHRRAPYGVPSPLVKRFYGERAEKGSLTITEPVGLGVGYGSSIFSPLISNSLQIEAWKEIISQTPGYVFVQLWHPGRLAGRGALNRNKVYYGDQAPEEAFGEGIPVGPSNIKAEGFNAELCDMNTDPHALTEEEIRNIIVAFRTAAENARTAGARGVEIEAGNNYLIHQFLDPSVNTREDAYGYKNLNGFQIVHDILTELNIVFGNDIGIHFSDPDLANQILKLDNKIAYVRLTVSSANEVPERFSSDLKSTKLIISGPSPSDLAPLLSSGVVDAVSFAELFTSNPDLRDRLLNEHPIAPYVKSDIGQPHGVNNYLTYPKYGEERVELPKFSAELPKRKVAIIGAGASGISTARAFLKFPNHEIDIFERRSVPGGIWSESAGESQASLVLPSVDTLIADPPLNLPSGSLPRRASRAPSTRFSQSPIYPGLITNVPQQMMFGFSAFKREIPKGDSRFYISAEEVVDHLAVVSKDYEQYIRYNSSVEHVTNIGSAEVPIFRLVIRKELPNGEDLWEEKIYDNVIVAVGHNWVPRIPDISGVKEFTGEITHSANYRGPERFKDKTVLVVGSRESGLDIMNQVRVVAKSVIIAQTSPHPFGIETVQKEGVTIKTALERLSGNLAFFSDGSSEDNIEAVIFATGYHFSFPFLSELKRFDRSGNPVPYSGKGGYRVPGLYEHTFDIYHEGIVFVGPPVGTPSFSAWEKQAFVAALVFNGLASLPSTDFMEKWERSRLDNPALGERLFHLLFAPGDRATFQESLNLIAADYLSRYESIDDELLRDWPTQYSGVLFKAFAYKKQQYLSR